MRAHPPMLVPGGTGRTGRRVVQRRAAPRLPVRSGSRPGGLPFDGQRPPAREAVLADVRAAYVADQPGPAAPGAAEEVGHLAVAWGVRRLALLSRRDEPEAVRAEEALRQSGAQWTVGRSARRPTPSGTPPCDFADCARRAAARIWNER
ncbi:hypothetical protein ACFY8O_29235 [Streptomyces argenteolus]|uniref:Uncharacterized protein n=1 Tax=Streptomyces argenteolus TaxID=67274 RepID=A0ABW6XE21_9ACTN